MLILSILFQVKFALCVFVCETLNWLIDAELPVVLGIYRLNIFLCIELFCFLMLVPVCTIA